jgi:hypothetical protein
MEDKGYLKAAGILVLGMHRSGTSLVTDVAARWGASLGKPEQLLGANRWNEAGHWEFAPAVRLNRRLLEAIGASTFLPPLDSDLPRLAGFAKVDQFRNQAVDILQSLGSEAAFWAVKDPQFALTLPFWEPLLSNVVFMVVVRDPLAIAQSLSKRDGVPLTAALLLWQRHMHCILRFLSFGSRRSLLVDYERLVSQPAASCAAIATFLQQECGPAEKGMDAVPAMAAAVRPELDHSPTQTGEGGRRVLSPDQELLYERLKAAAAKQDLSELDPKDAYLYPGWHDYLLCWRTVERLKQSCIDMRKGYCGPTLNRVAATNYTTRMEPAETA